MLSSQVILQRCGLAGSKKGRVKRNFCVNIRALAVGSIIFVEIRLFSSVNNVLANVTSEFLLSIY